VRDKLLRFFRYHVTSGRETGAGGRRGWFIYLFMRSDCLCAGLRIYSIYTNADADAAVQVIYMRLSPSWMDAGDSMTRRVEGNEREERGRGKGRRDLGMDE